MFGKKNSKWSEFALLNKRKEVKEDPNSVANGRRRKRFQCLVANGRSKRRFQCLVVNGREGEAPFHLSHFPPNKFDLTFIFSFDLKFLLYHGSRSLLTHFLFFPWPTNYNRAFWCHKSSAHSLSIWFWLNFFFFLEIIAPHMATSYEPQAP
jgi:hypothetical protein